MNVSSIASENALGESNDRMPNSDKITYYSWVLLLVVAILSTLLIVICVVSSALLCYRLSINSDRFQRARRWLRPCLAPKTFPPPMREEVELNEIPEGPPSVLEHPYNTLEREQNKTGISAQLAYKGNPRKSIIPVLRPPPSWSPSPPFVPQRPPRSRWCPAESSNYHPCQECKLRYQLYCQRNLPKSRNTCCCSDCIRSRKASSRCHHLHNYHRRIYDTQHRESLYEACSSKVQVHAQPRHRPHCNRDLDDVIHSSSPQLQRENSIYVRKSPPPLKPRLANVLAGGNCGNHRQDSLQHNKRNSIETPDPALDSPQRCDRAESCLTHPAQTGMNVDQRDVLQKAEFRLKPKSEINGYDEVNKRDHVPLTCLVDTPASTASRQIFEEAAQNYWKIVHTRDDELSGDHLDGEESMATQSMSWDHLTPDPSPAQNSVNKDITGLYAQGRTGCTTDECFIRHHPVRQIAVSHPLEKD